MSEYVPSSLNVGGSTRLGTRTTRNTTASERNASHPRVGRAGNRCMWRDGSDEVLHYDVVSPQPPAPPAWTLFEPIHAIVYFAPEAKNSYGAAGLRGGWM